MEQKLKRQRNRLFRRITWILLAVWIVVSVIYSTIMLSGENLNLQNQELATLSAAKQRLTAGMRQDNMIRAFLLETSSLSPEGSVDMNETMRQLLITDLSTDAEVLNTAGKINVVFGFKVGEESLTEIGGVLDYQSLRDSMTDAQYEAIAAALRTSLPDGKHYELVCTEFALNTVEFYPIEVAVALVEDDTEWFESDELIAAYSLHPDIGSMEIYQCNNVWRNVIPKEFLLDGVCCKDYLSSLTDDQLEQSQGTVPTGLLDYLFYTTDYVYASSSSSGVHTTYRIRYAREIHLWNLCKGTVLWGITALFGFFLVIAVILCVMVWRMVKVQILQEQKRADLTNALAHDIKTPLFIISGYAYSLQEDIDSSERDDYLSKIIEQTENINQLVHRMLNLSKLDSYKMTLNRTELDLYELTAETLRRYPHLPDGKSFVLHHSGSHLILADQELLSTVLQNLIENAVKYSLPDSEIRIDVTEQTLRITNKSEHLTKAELKQIWQPYIRKDKSRHQKGNGLGLSIVKSILDLHGAKYESRQQGDDFIMLLQFGENRRKSSDNKPRQAK